LDAPSVLDAYRIGLDELEKFASRQTQNYEHFSTVQSTVIAHIQVECDEVFSVIDLETQQVLQGYADHTIRRVQHIVRLEQVSEWIMHSNGGLSVQSGSWQITDWDDLLDGNIFYL
jgi:hypothetical protein